MYYFVNKEKFYHTSTSPVWFYFTVLVCAHFCIEIERCQLWKLLKYFNILWQKSGVRLEYVLSDSVWFALSFVVWIEFWQEVEKYDVDIWLKYLFFLLRNLLSDCNWTRTHNHLVRKGILNHLTKPASLTKRLTFRLRTKWLWFRVQLQSLKLQISRLLRARSSLTFRQL